MLLIAIARGSTAGGTILGAIALIAGPEKTRATPCSAARPNSTGSVNPSLQVNQPSIAAMPMSIRLEKIATLRRSNRSDRSEEHTSELQSLMRTSYDVFCLKKKRHNNNI